MRPPSPRKRRERTTNNKAVWSGRVSIHTRASKQPQESGVCEQHRRHSPSEWRLRGRPVDTLRVEDGTERRCRPKKTSALHSYVMNQETERGQFDRHYPHSRFVRRRSVGSTSCLHGRSTRTHADNATLCVYSGRLSLRRNPRRALNGDECRHMHRLRNSYYNASP